MKIQKAKIISAIKAGFKDNGSKYGKEYYGYVITTDIGTVRIGIDSFQQCCEDWGVEISVDPHLLIGKTLINIEETEYDDVVEIYANSSKSEECNEIYLKIEFEDDLPVYVLLYNIHNGYYEHKILVNIYGEDLSLTDL